MRFYNSNLESTGYVFATVVGLFNSIHDDSCFIKIAHSITANMHVGTV